MSTRVICIAMPLLSARFDGGKMDGRACSPGRGACNYFYVLEKEWWRDVRSLTSFVRQNLRLFQDGDIFEMEILGCEINFGILSERWNSDKRKVKFLIICRIISLRFKWDQEFVGIKWKKESWSKMEINKCENNFWKIVFKNFLYLERMNKFYSMFLFYFESFINYGSSC